MTALAWTLLAVVLVLDTLSHLLLKGSTGRADARSSGHLAFIAALLADPLFWIAIGSFLMLLFAWVAFFSLVPLSQAVMTGSITIVGVLLGGRLVFGERITPARATAAGLIAAGVLLVGWGAA